MTYQINTWFNKWRSRDEYMRQWNRPSLVQRTTFILKQNISIYTEEKIFGNCKMAAFSICLNVFNLKRTCFEISMRDVKIPWMFQIIALSERSTGLWILRCKSNVNAGMNIWRPNPFTQLFGETLIRVIRDCQMCSIWWFYCWNLFKWRNNEPDGISNHLHLDCFLSRLFRRRSKKTSMLRVTSL